MNSDQRDLITEHAQIIIEAKLKEVKRILSECENIADDTNTYFHFSVAYGMGGSYEPGEGWISSSQNC